MLFVYVYLIYFKIIILKLILDVSQVINVTFQRIDKSQLTRLLGGVSGKIFNLQRICILKNFR